MSDNLAMSRRAWDALNRRDFDLVLENIHPDVEWRPALGPGGIEGTVLRGRDAYERWLRVELLEVWEEFRGDNLEFTELPGDRILLLGELVARGRASGVEMRTPFGQIAELRDGLVIRLTAFADHASALAAAGAGLPDVLRRAIDAYNARDLDAFAELCLPDFEWRPAMAGGVEGRAYRGLEEFERYLAELRDTWDEMRIVPGAVREWGEGYVLDVTAHARGHASGVHVAAPAAAVFTMRGDRIAAVELFMDRAAAVAAAGLTPGA